MPTLAHQTDRDRLGHQSPQGRVASRARWMPAVMLAAALAGCATTAPDATVRDLALLSTLPDQGLDAPDTVRAGVPFTVTGYGAGSGTLACNAPDGTTVTTSDSVIRITAYMRYPALDVPCTRDYRTYPFTVQVVFPRPGTGTVRFIGGRAVQSRTPTPDSVVRRVLVRP